MKQDTPLSNSETDPTSAPIEDELQRIREERKRFSRLIELDKMEDRPKQQLRARNSDAQ
jgi:hypothetical protein